MTTLSDTLMKHFRAPSRVGRVEAATGSARRENVGCGDVVEFSVRVHDGAIAQARFLCQGCSASIGAASYLAERAEGAAREVVAAWTVEDVMEQVGETRAVRRHAVSLALGALQDAIAAG